MFNHLFKPAVKNLYKKEMSPVGNDRCGYLPLPDVFEVEYAPDITGGEIDGFSCIYHGRRQKERVQIFSSSLPCQLTPEASLFEWLNEQADTLRSNPTLLYEYTDIILENVYLSGVSVYRTAHVINKGYPRGLLYETSWFFITEDNHIHEVCINSQDEQLFLETKEHVENNYQITTSPWKQGRFGKIYLGYLTMPSNWLILNESYGDYCLDLDDETGITLNAFFEDDTPESLADSMEEQERDENNEILYRKSVTLSCGVSGYKIAARCPHSVVIYYTLPFPNHVTGLITCIGPDSQIDNLCQIVEETYNYEP